jgi:hypothetical protein
MAIVWIQEGTGKWVNCARCPVWYCGDCTDKSRSSVHTENVAVAPAATVTTVQLSELQGALGSGSTCVRRWSPLRRAARKPAAYQLIAETFSNTSTSQFCQIYSSRDAVFWNANNRYHRFGGVWCLHLQGIKIKLQVYVTPTLNMEATLCSETLVSSYNRACHRSGL